MSVRASSGLPSNCSGAAYSAVPTNMPVFVNPPAPSSLATPKSVR